MNDIETLESQHKKDKRKMQNFLWFVGIAFLFGSLVSIGMPYAITHWSFGELGVKDSNAMGDTIGGTMGPTVALIGAGLTFLAFYAQIKANSEQRYQFGQSLLQQKDALEKQTEQFEKTIAQQEKAIRTQKIQADEQLQVAKEQTLDAQQEFERQEKATRRERFANRYYLMLSVHRDNIASIEVENKKKRFVGRNAMLPLFNELEFIYWTTVAFYKNKWVIDQNHTTLSETDLFQISYLSFFFGFGGSSTPSVLDLVGDRLYGFTEELHEHLLVVKEHKFDSAPTHHGTFQYNRDTELGEGHLHRLSHYFRHVFQTVKFVNDQDPGLLSYKKKYGYVSNLRAQMSVHEQLLLYYNARSVLGKPWLDYKPEKGEVEGLLARYCMIKSIPLNAANFFENPAEFFSILNKEGKPMFEWTEIKNRINSL